MQPHKGIGLNDIIDNFWQMFKEKLFLIVFKNVPRDFRLNLVEHNYLYYLLPFQIPRKYIKE